MTRIRAASWFADLRFSLGVFRRQFRLSAAAAACIAIGIAASALALGGLLYGLPPFDVASFAVAAAVILVIAVAASLIPASRAAAVEPSAALRS